MSALARIKLGEAVTALNAAMAALEGASRELGVSVPGRSAALARTQAETARLWAQYTLEQMREAAAVNLRP